MTGSILQDISFSKNREEREKGEGEKSGKGMVFEKETQEVLSSIGSAYCLLKRLGKNIQSAHYSLQRLVKHH